MLVTAGPQPFDASPLCLQLNRPPAKLNLLTCQVKPSTDDKKCFDLVSREC